LGSDGKEPEGFQVCEPEAETLISASGHKRTVVFSAEVNGAADGAPVEMNQQDGNVSRLPANFSGLPFAGIEGADGKDHPRIRQIAPPIEKLSRRRLLRSLATVAAASPVCGNLLSRAAALPAPYTFEEVPASKSGIRWVHSAGKSAEKYLPESSGAGCAFLDFDNDGWMDIYLVNSGKANFYNPPHPLQNALYRNNRDGTFTDVTVKAGVTGGGYGMGVAVGDYNGDGFPDIYVTQCGHNILYRNNRDGTFTDVTEQAGVGAGGWSSSAVWFDYDNDGRLDLFVCQFAEFDMAHGCGTDSAGVHHYCIPRIFNPKPSWLFHNNGDGTFTDVSKSTGIAEHLGKAWGVVATDVKNDGKMDLFVSNDTVPNFLFMNRGGSFEETGLAAEVAYSADGRARSGMGVDSADFNEDGLMDLFVSNIDWHRHVDSLDERMGAQVLRLRQRRQSRPDRGERFSRRPVRRGFFFHPVETALAALSP